MKIAQNKSWERLGMPDVGSAFAIHRFSPSLSSIVDVQVILVYY